MRSERTKGAVALVRELLLVLLDPTCDTDSVVLIARHSESFVPNTFTRIANDTILEVCDLSLFPARFLLDDLDLLLVRVKLSILKFIFLAILVLEQSCRKHQILQLTRILLLARSSTTYAAPLKNPGSTILEGFGHQMIRQEVFF